MSKKEVKKIGCLEWKGTYLVIEEDGKTLVLPSEKDFNKYLTDNNCEVKD